jgi:DNA-binding LacI/PurR family transcriptional regulator
MPRETESFIPIYKRLVERYRQDILTFALKPGDRIDSIAQIQKKSGVGRETAKRVLAMLEEEGFIVQLQGRGSFVRDQGPQKQVWALVFPFYAIQYEELILELAGHAKAQGREFRHVCTYNNYEEEIRVVAELIQERCEAVIVIPTLDESRTWQRFYSRLPASESSIVLLDHTMTSNDFRFVVQSYDLGVSRALLYMMDQKEGGIAFVENELWAGRNMVLELMRGTYQDLMRTRRPDFEALILPRASSVDADGIREHGVTGIFCCDDVSAVHVVGRLKEQGLDVPGDVNVVGYGNTHLSRFFTPPISSVDPHNAEMAEVLARFLGPNGADEKDRSHQQYVIQPELVIRGT